MQVGNKRLKIRLKIVTNCRRNRAYVRMLQIHVTVKVSSNPSIHVTVKVSSNPSIHVTVKVSSNPSINVTVKVSSNPSFIHCVDVCIHHSLAL